MQKLTAREKIRMSMESVYDNEPFLARVASGLQVIESEEIQTFATDGKSLLFNRAFVDDGIGLNPPGEMSISEVTWVLYHEYGHVILGHMLRFDNKMDRTDANIGMDLALNSLLKNFNIKPSARLQEFACYPGQGTYSSLADGKEFEWYFDQIKRDKQPPQQSEPEKGQNSSENVTGKGSESDKDAQDSQKRGKSSPESNGKGSESGSKSDKTAFSIGEVLPHPESGGTESEKLAAVQEWQQVVAESVNAAKSCGKLAGWMETLAGKVYGKPQVDWRSLLRRWMNKMAQTGSSFTRPSRRQFGSKLLFPANISNNASDGVCILDTSGSMSEADMNVALREVESVLQSFPNAKVTMIQCDTRVIEESTKVFTKSDFPLRRPESWRGRGGTHMEPAFDKVRAEKSKYKWAIICSDMEWSYRAIKDTGIPTLWLCVRPNMISDRTQFGTCIHCPASNKN